MNDTEKILLCGIFVTAIVIFHLVQGYKKRRKLHKRIEELTNYLEQVNIGAGSTIVQTEEDMFSHLQDEIYKTVTSLCQTKELALQAKNNFADNLANIAHQIKTPITSAFLSLQLMEEACPNQYGLQIRKQLERLNKMEEALITLSKIDSGTLPLEKGKVDVYTALHLAGENLQDLLEKEGVTVKILNQDCVEIKGDLEWTMQAFMNLIKNCMEHSKAGDNIYCDYQKNPLYVVIKIWDEGEGFLEEDMPRLFERFYRGRNASGSGIGIGLALAKAIFELQNATVSAYNILDKGACFEIRIYSH